MGVTDARHAHIHARVECACVLTLSITVTYEQEEERRGKERTGPFSKDRGGREEGGRLVMGDGEEGRR